MSTTSSLGNTSDDDDDDPIVLDSTDLEQELQQQLVQRREQQLTATFLQPLASSAKADSENTPLLVHARNQQHPSTGSFGSYYLGSEPAPAIPEDRVQDDVIVPAAPVEDDDSDDDDDGPASSIRRNDSFFSSCTALSEDSEYDLDTGMRFASMVKSSKQPRGGAAGHHLLPFFHPRESAAAAAALNNSHTYYYHAGGAVEGISRYNSPKPTKIWNLHHSHVGGGSGGSGMNNNSSSSTGGILLKSSSTPHMGSYFGTTTTTTADAVDKQQHNSAAQTTNNDHKDRSLQTTTTEFNGNATKEPNKQKKQRTRPSKPKLFSKKKVVVVASLVVLVIAIMTVVIWLVWKGQQQQSEEEETTTTVPDTDDEASLQRRLLVFTVSLSATIKLLAAIGLGALAASTPPSAAASHMILDQAAVSALSRLVFWVFQPAFFLCRVALTMAAATQHAASKKDGITRSSLALMPLVALMQIGIGSAVAKLVTFFSHRTHGTMSEEERTFVENSKRDAQVCMTFANSGPLPLLFADALFAGGDGGVEADVTACISFYLLGWSPTFWSYGRYLVGTYGNDDVDKPALSRRQRGICGRVWDAMKDFGEQVKKVFAPPIIGSSLGIVIGSIPLLRDSILQSNGLLYPLFGALNTLGSAYLPSVILVLAGSLVGGSKRRKAGQTTTTTTSSSSSNKNQSSLQFTTLVSILTSRFLLAPMASIAVVYVLTHLNLLPPTGTRTHAIVSFVMLMEGCMPPAQNSILMLQLEGLAARAEAMARTVTLMYVLSVIPVTIWLMAMMGMSGVMAFR